MTEWIRLGAAAGTLVVALLCALAAVMTDENRLRFSRRGRYGFWIAGVLLILCMPLLTLDGAGTPGPLGAGGSPFCWRVRLF